MAEALRQLILGPVELALDGLFSVSLRLTGSPGASLLLLSLAVTLLVSPLYRRADALQREERETAKALRPGVKLIKSAFTGDERFMILQTYYRQHHYRPWYALKSSLSLLLQIPFFLAAYRYLSSLEVLRGASFGPITDLGAPDGLLRLGGSSLPLLPVLMTLINLLSGLVYARKLPLRDRIQPAALSLVFLVLLYRSPSGLVLYWTMNNLLSLIRNLFRRFRPESPAESRPEPEAVSARDRRFVLVCGLILTLLTGVLIPSALIRTSPSEFVEIARFESPLIFLQSSLMTAAGTFLLWGMIYFHLSSRRIRKAFPPALAFLSVSGPLNDRLFGRYGNLSSLLRFDIPVAEQVTLSSVLLNLGLLFLLAGAAVWLWKRKPALLRAFCLAECAAVAALSAVNTAEIARQVPEMERLASQASAQAAGEASGIISLDRSGKNVVVLMLDKAVGAFAPYLFEEKPLLREQFAGFTCYPNTLSYGGHTNSGAPALFGGYAYTPDRMDRRKDLPLAEKHNEALRVMPAVFSRAGFRVTVCDPPLAGYQWIPDLSIYADLPEVRAFLTEGLFLPDSDAQLRYNRSVRIRNFFRYSLFRVAPVVLQSGLYDDGNYLHADGVDDGAAYSLFMRSYQVLAGLSGMTAVRDTGENTFLMLANHTTHDVLTLAEPAYEPVFGKTDNRAWDEAHPDRTAADGSRLPLQTEDQRKHYQSNMAALLRIGEWLDSLRAAGVYDNTRIIVAADHGWDLEFEDWKRTDLGINTMNYNPLLLVKDFGSREPFAFSENFMTNADTPVLAFAGLIPDPVNPFTGEAISDQAKAAERQTVIESPWQFADNNGTAFAEEQVFILENRDVRVLRNWKKAPSAETETIP